MILALENIKFYSAPRWSPRGIIFPNVSLVGVINADIGLSLPDFRASERVEQLADSGRRTGWADPRKRETRDT